MNDEAFKWVVVLLLSAILGATVAGCKCNVSETNCLDELRAVQLEWEACRNELQSCQTLMHAQGFDPS